MKMYYIHDKTYIIYIYKIIHYTYIMSIIYQTISLVCIVCTIVKIHYYLKRKNEINNYLKQYTVIESSKTLVPV